MASKNIEDFKVIYKVLKYLSDSMDYPELDLDKLNGVYYSISELRFNRLYAILIEEGFISGASYQRDLNGAYIVGKNLSRITFKGMQFLQENSTMRKIAAALMTGIDIAK